MARPKAPNLGEVAYQVSAQDNEIVGRLRSLIVASLKEIEKDQHKVRNEYQQSMRVASIAKLHAEMRQFIKTCARVVTITAEEETDPRQVRGDVINYLRVLGPEEGAALFMEAFGRAPAPLMLPEPKKPKSYMEDLDYCEPGPDEALA